MANVNKRAGAAAASIVVRGIRREDARCYLEIHHAAIRGIAANDYPPAVIEAWARPITESMLERVRANQDEVRLVAEVDGEPVGIASVEIETATVRACYVLPQYIRRGVGAALPVAIETIAQTHGLDSLRVHSSIGAESFYAAMGYRVEDRSEVKLRSGEAMAAVQMVKTLR